MGVVAEIRLEGIFVNSRRAGERQLMMRLDAAPELLGDIRRIVRSQLALWEQPHLADDVTLGVDELLTNVYRHTSSKRCTLLLEALPDRVCVIVSDADQRKPEIREPGWDAENGRGLTLVASMSHNWGVVITPTGKDIWFSLLSSSEEEHKAP